MAKLIKANGEETEVTPKNGSEFSLEELREFVGGYIEVVPTKDNQLMVLNEEGQIHRLPVNTKATELTRGVVANDDLIVGDVLVCDRDQVE